MYRAELKETETTICGSFYSWNNKSYILQKDIWDGCSTEIFMYEVKPETLEIYLFGEWRLVSELEKPCEWKCVKLESTEFILYDTKCDESNIWLDESVEKLGYKFCPYCGRPIKEI